jgi:hypothetical protein
MEFDDRLARTLFRLLNEDGVRAGNTKFLAFFADGLEFVALDSSRAVVKFSLNFKVGKEKNE